MFLMFIRLFESDSRLPILRHNGSHCNINIIPPTTPKPVDLIKYSTIIINITLYTHTPQNYCKYNIFINKLALPTAQPTYSYFRRLPAFGHKLRFLLFLCINPLNLES